MKLNKYKNLLLSLIIVVEIFCLNIYQANALGGLLNAGTGMLGISPAKIIEQAAEDLKLPLDMAKDLMKYGSSMQKKMAEMTPSVETHFFPPRTPKIGEVMTMKAFPQNFATNGEALHYIVALKHNDPNRNGDVVIPGIGSRAVHNGNVDWNGNNRFCDNADNPDMQDCILAATRLRAQGTTKPGGINRNFNYNNVPSDDNDGYKAMLGGYNETQEENGFTGDVHIGEDNNDWMGSHFPRGQRPPGPKCYVPDLKGSEVGGIFELASMGESNAKESGGGDGQASFYTEEGACEGTAICAIGSPLDCGDSLQTVPEYSMGNASATGGSGGSGNGNSSSGESSGSGGSGGSASIDLMTPEHERPSEGFQFRAWTDSGLDISCSSSDSHSSMCPEGTTPICIDSDNLDITCDEAREVVAENEEESGAIMELGQEISSCEANISGVNDVENQCLSAFYGLFPNPFDLNIDDITTQSPMATGELGVEYEKFFGLDPLNASTAGNGLTDGQNIAGLNADQFSWEYTPGDQISLIVAGRSGLLGPHDDAKNMNMFALPKNNFSAFNFMEDANKYAINDAEGHLREIPTIPGIIPGSGGGNDQSALLSSMNANWIDPSSGHQAKQIKIEIEHQPKSPLVSSVIGQSNVLTLIADVKGIEQDARQLKYEWEIYTGNQKYIYAKNMPAVDDNNDSWHRVEDRYSVCRTGLITRGPVRGVGLNTLKLDLNNLNSLHCESDGDDVDRSTHKYILARLTVSEYFDKSELYTDTAGSLDSQIGFGDTMIKLDRSNSDFILTVNNGIRVDSTGGNNNVFPVLNNQIITARTDIENGNVMENIHWTLNGKTIDSATDNSVVSFPVSGRIGDKFIVNMTGNNVGMVGGNQENLGDAVNVTKVLVITTPKIMITPSGADAMNNQEIGSYNFSAMNDEEIPDYRRSVLNFSGEAIELTIDNDQVNSLEIPQTTPFYLPEMLTNIRWYADGILQENCTGFGCNVNFPNAQIGSFHTVSLDADYVPTSENRRNLLDLYGISRYRSSGERLTAQVRLKVEAPPEGGKIKSVKIFASLIGNLPNQVMFLFRIILTITVIIAVPGFIFSFERNKLS